MPLRPSDVRQSTHLTNFALQYGTGTRDLDKALTFVTTEFENDKFWIHEVNGRRREQGLKRADGAAAARKALKLTERTFAVEEYAVEILLGSRLLRHAGPALSLREQAAVSCSGDISLERAFQTYTLLTTDANYASGHSVTLTDELDDYVNGDVVGTFEDALDRLVTSCGGVPAGCKIKALMPVGVRNAIASHPDVQESVKYVGTERARAVDDAELAKFLKVDELVAVRDVADTSVAYPDTLDQPQNGSRLWADTADQISILMVNEGLGGAPAGQASFTAIGAFRTHPLAVSEYDPGDAFASQDGRANVTRASEYWDLRIVAVDSASSGKGVAMYQVKNCLT